MLCYTFLLLLETSLFKLVHSLSIFLFIPIHHILVKLLKLETEPNELTKVDCITLNSI